MEIRFNNIAAKTTTNLLHCVKLCLQNHRLQFAFFIKLIELIDSNIKICFLCIIHILLNSQA